MGSVLGAVVFIVWLVHKYGVPVIAVSSEHFQGCTLPLHTNRILPTAAFKAMTDTVHLCSTPVSSDVYSPGLATDRVAVETEEVNLCDVINSMKASVDDQSSGLSLEKALENLDKINKAMAKLGEVRTCFSLYQCMQFWQMCVAGLLSQPSGAGCLWWGSVWLR